MALNNPVLIAIAVLVAFLFIFLLFRKWVYSFADWNASDVVPFLRKIDLEILWGIFHPEAEKELRERLPADEFRRVQIKRYHLALQYCADLTHNAYVVSKWSRTERRRGDLAPQVARVTLDLLSVCAQCRMASMYVRLCLCCWLLRMALLPLSTPPSFERLLKNGSGPLLSFYDRVKAKAEEFSLAYNDEEFSRKIIAAL